MLAETARQHGHPLTGLRPTAPWWAVHYGPMSRRPVCPVTHPGWRGRPPTTPAAPTGSPVEGSTLSWRLDGTWRPVSELRRHTIPQESRLRGQSAGPRSRRPPSARADPWPTKTRSSPPSWTTQRSIAVNDVAAEPVHRCGDEAVIRPRSSRSHGPSCGRVTGAVAPDTSRSSKLLRVDHAGSGRFRVHRQDDLGQPRKLSRTWRAHAMRGTFVVHRGLRDHSPDSRRRRRTASLPRAPTR